MTLREFLGKIEEADTDRGATTIRGRYRIHEEHFFFSDGTQSDYFQIQRSEGSGIWKNVAFLDVDEGMGSIDSLALGCDPVMDALWTEVGFIMEIWNKED